MSKNKGDEVAELKALLNDLVTRLEFLEAEKDKSFNQRMSYLTWSLANPVSLIFIPAFFSIGLEVMINNWESNYTGWTLAILTKSTNWTIPLLVATTGLIVSFGNKLYLLIQEKGDMSLLAMLEAKINGQTRRMNLEREVYEAKRDADMKATEAKRDADMKAAEAKRDAEYALLVEKLSGTIVKQAILETKVENLENQ